MYFKPLVKLCLCSKWSCKWWRASCSFLQVRLLHRCSRLPAEPVSREGQHGLQLGRSVLPDRHQKRPADSSGLAGGHLVFSKSRRYIFTSATLTCNDVEVSLGGSLRLQLQSETVKETVSYNSFKNSSLPKHFHEMLVFLCTVHNGSKDTITCCWDKVRRRSCQLISQPPPPPSGVRVKRKNECRWCFWLLVMWLQSKKASETQSSSPSLKGFQESPSDLDRYMALLYGWSFTVITAHNLASLFSLWWIFFWLVVTKALMLWQGTLCKQQN